MSLSDIPTSTGSSPLELASPIPLTFCRIQGVQMRRMADLDIEYPMVSMRIRYDDSGTLPILTES